MSKPDNFFGDYSLWIDPGCTKPAVRVQYKTYLFDPSIIAVDKNGTTHQFYIKNERKAEISILYISEEQQDKNIRILKKPSTGLDYGASGLLIVQRLNATPEDNAAGFLGFLNIEIDVL